MTSLFDLVSCLSHVQSRQNARRANSASVQQIGGWNASVNNQTRDPDKSKQTLSIFGVISCSPSTHLFLISYLRPNSAPAGAPWSAADWLNCMLITDRLAASRAHTHIYAHLIKWEACYDLFIPTSSITFRPSSPPPLGHHTTFMSSEIMQQLTFYRAAILKKKKKKAQDWHL